jgi:hypothetical protein
MPDHLTSHFDLLIRSDNIQNELRGLVEESRHLRRRSSALCRRIALANERELAALYRSEL